MSLIFSGESSFWAACHFSLACLWPCPSRASVTKVRGPDSRPLTWVRPFDFRGYFASRGSSVEMHSANRTIVAIARSVYRRLTLCW
jgi:hypothetical protein